MQQYIQALSQSNQGNICLIYMIYQETITIHGTSKADYNTLFAKKCKAQLYVHAAGTVTTCCEIVIAGNSTFSCVC